MHRFASAVACLQLLTAPIWAAYLTGLPTVPFEHQSSSDDAILWLDLGKIQNIVVDDKYADTTDEAGWTLIPPTLHEFAQTFATDLGGEMAVQLGSSDCTDAIYLTVANHSSFTDAAGRWTSEAYRIEITDDKVTIEGASPLGAWWGTRTILQQASLNDGKLPLGVGIDSPGWGTRGYHLDVGRHYYPTSFLIEMCNWMSFYKQNTFHIHMSDNLYNNVKIYSLERQMELYAAFRPWSDDPALAGLNKRQNESYTREQFDEFQQSCAARGVTVIPEIEAPGHALVISQWKPELAIDSSIDLLNISYPDTIPTMKTIWKTILPWCHSKVVHIGADEYVDSLLSKDALVSYYNDFVIALNEFIGEESGKQIRIWGTFPPKDSYTNNIPKDVAVQHWAQFEDNPYFDYIQNGYNVINSDDSFYIVQKYSVPYPQVLNKTRIFHGNPADGSPWSPNIFDVNNATNNPPRDNPSVLGHLAAQWNDYGPNTSTYLEAYHPWRDYGAALADKQWGGLITEDEYDVVFPVLRAAAPAQNPDREVKSKGSTILEYDFTGGAVESVAQSVKDVSGNDYHGTTSCGFSRATQGAAQALSITSGCSVTTPLTSKGNDYTLSFTIRQLSSSRPGPIFTGPDSELWSGNGTSTQLMFMSAGNAFALNYTLPVGEWVDASVIGRGNQTFFTAATQGGGGKTEEMEFTTTVGINGESFAWARMAFVAPLQVIGGGEWEGELRSVKLIDHA